MSEQAFIDLARDVWRKDEPGDLEVHAGAQRARLRAKPARRRVQRAPLLAAALVLVAAVAWAASGAWQDGSKATRDRGAALGRGIAPPTVAELFSRGVAPVRSAPPTVEERPEPDALRREPEDGDGSADPSAPARAPVIRREATALAPRDSEVRAAPPDANAPTWAEVARALESGDDESAKGALERLERTGDADTIAKARLGRAQLALARGDRGAARKLAREVDAMPGVSPAIAARARDLAARAR